MPRSRLATRSARPKARTWLKRFDRNGDGTFAPDDVSRTTPYGSLHYKPAYEELTRRIDGPITQQSLERFVSEYNRGVGRPTDHDQAVADRDSEEQPLQQLKRDLLDRKVTVDDVASKVPARAQQ